MCLSAVSLPTPSRLSLRPDNPPFFHNLILTHNFNCYVFDSLPTHGWHLNYSFKVYRQNKQLITIYILAVYLFDNSVFFFVYRRWHLVYLCVYSRHLYHINTVHTIIFKPVKEVCKGCFSVYFTAFYLLLSLGQVTENCNISLSLFVCCPISMWASKLCSYLSFSLPVFSCVSSFHLGFSAVRPSAVLGPLFWACCPWLFPLSPSVCLFLLSSFSVNGGLELFCVFFVFPAPFSSELRAYAWIEHVAWWHLLYQAI